MTLAGLIKQASLLGRRVTDAGIPLILNGRECKIDLSLESDYDDGRIWVDVKITRRRRTKKDKELPKCHTCQRYEPIAIKGSSQYQDYCLRDHNYWPCDPEESDNCEYYKPREQ